MVWPVLHLVTNSQLVKFLELLTLFNISYQENMKDGIKGGGSGGGGFGI